jgi:hypothetical protein
VQCVSDLVMEENPSNRIESDEMKNGINLKFETFDLRRRFLVCSGYSQNFLRKFVKISVTLGLNIISFLRLKELFKSKY